MSKEATGQFGARIGSSAYWIRINHAAGLRDLMGSEPEYHAILQRVGSRASAAIEEIYDDLANQGSKIRYISSSNRNALAKQVVGLYDVCKMTGTSASHSSDCIYALNMSALSLWNNPFRDERAIDKAISIINRQSHFSNSEALKILEEGSKWSVSFVAGSDTIKKAFLESVLQGKNNSFLQDVANEYQHRNTIQHFTGKCGYEIGSRAYLEHFESQVFGFSWSKGRCDARRVCRHSYTSRNWYCYRWLYRWSDSWRCRLKYRRQTRRICRRYHSIGVIQMLFFKKKPKPTPVEPDTTRIKLYNGAFYPYDSAPSPYRVYTLRDWVEGEDCDFSELAMDCALAILDDYPVVINCLRPTHLKDDFLRNKDTDVIDYLKSISWTDFGWQSSVVTMTNGPDRNLISTQNIDDETILFTFYAYRHLPSEGTLPGTPFVPDVEICFAHLHTRLVITTMNGIEVYADKIRAVCEKYGKTLVVQELPSRANDFD